MADRAWGSALACGLALVALTACSSEPDVPPRLAEADRPLQESPNVPGTLVWKKPGLNAAQYTSFIIAQPEIYRGTDTSFGGATEAEKATMAQYMTREFRRALGERYRISSSPGPGTATLTLTLVGMSDNVPVAATVSRIAPAGIVTNVVRSATDNTPTFSGTVTLKGDITDSANGDRLATFVATRAPKAIDLGATLSSKDAQEAAITAAANDLRDSISKAQTAAVPGR